MDSIHISYLMKQIHEDIAQVYILESMDQKNN